MALTERVAKVETEISNLKEMNTKEHQEIKEIIEKFINTAEQKFASKMVEKIVYGMVGVVMLTVMGSLISLITK